MSFKNTFGTDVKSKNEGKWFDLNDEVKFKIACSKNSENVNALKELMSQNNTHSIDKIDHKILARTIIKNVVKDWSGIKDDDNNDVVFSKENIDNFLLEEQDEYFIFDEVLEWIINTSSDIKNFRIGLVNDKIKN